MKLTQLPLRIWIPSALALLALTLTAIAVTTEYVRWQHTESRLIQRAAKLADNLVARYQFASAQTNHPDLKPEFTRLKMFPSLRQAMVVDATDQVVIAHDAALIGQPVGATLGQASASLITAARRTLARQSERNPDGSSIRVATPFSLESDAPNASATRVLYTEVDLEGVGRTALGEMLFRSFVMGSVAALVTFVIWLYFRRTFERRLNQLVSAVAANAEGGNHPLSTDGTDELAAVARAVKKMTENLAAHDTAVRASEARLREAQRVAKMGSWMWEPDGKLSWSAAMYEIFGIPADQAPTFARFVETVHPADRVRTTKGFEAWVQSNRTSNQEEYRIVRPDGTVRHILAIGEMVRGSANQAVHAVGTVQDITERKQAEHTLEKHLSRQTLLLDVTAAVVAAPESREALIRVLFNKVAAHLNVDVGFNYELVKGALRLVAGFGIPTELQPSAQRLEIGQAFCGTVAETGLPLAADADRVSNDPKGQFVKGMGVRCYMCHPLLSREGRLLGTFSVASRERDVFAADEIEFLQTLCHFVALAWERIAAEEALRASEDRFRSVVDAAPTAMLMADEAGRIALVNRQLERLLGYAREEIVGQRVEQLLAPRLRLGHAQRYREFLQAPRLGETRELFALRKDGTEVALEVGLGPIHQPDGEFVLAAVVDITERNKAERARQNHLARQALLLDVTAAVVAAPLSREALVRIVFEKIAPHLNADVGFNFRREGAGLRLVAGLGISPELEAKFQTLALGQEFCGTVAATGTPVAIDAKLIAGDPKGKLLTDLNVRCYICHPLRSSDGQLLGTFSLGSHVKDAFEPDEIEFHQTLCHFLSLAWERIAAEEALRASEDRFRSVVEAAPSAMLMADSNGCITLVNRQLERLFGYSRQEMIGQTIEMLLPAANRAVHVGQRQGYFRAPSQRSMGEGRELFGRRKDGSEVAVEVGLGPILRPEGAFVLAAVVDITERKQAERALRESEARFRELAETISEVFWVTSADKFDILYVSPAYQTIWGRTCDSLYANPSRWLDCIHDEDRDRVRHAAETRQIDGTYDEQYRIVRPDGTLRWIHDRAFPVRDASGNVVRIAGIAEDITERRRLEDHVRQSQKMEALGQLAGGVAHDFNNILAVFMLQLDLAHRLLGPGIPPAVGDSLNELRKGAQRAAALTRQLLLFGRREEMQFSRVDLNELLENLAKMLRRIVGEDIDFILKGAAKPLWVEVDAGMIEQVVVNLCVNARDAMPNGGRLTVEARLCAVDAAHVQSHVDARPGVFACLAVTDTGTGIDPAVLPRIFEPFFTTKEVGRGTGLGLATVSGVIKQHQSWLEVETAIGKGTTFRTYLPLAATKAEPPPVTAPVPQSPAGGSETVLLVEDEAMVRMVVAMTLKQQGYAVLEAESGPDGWLAWERNRGKIALVLSDMTMPGGMSGLDLAERIWAEQRDLPFLIFSGYSTSSAAAKRAAEANHRLVYVAKPCESTHLLNLVRELLDQGTGTAPSFGKTSPTV